MSFDTPTRSAISTTGIPTDSKTWISWRLSSGSISSASHSPPPLVAIVPTIIAAIIAIIITCAPSSEEPQNFRNGTPQNFWNHQGGRG
ncbi:MAG: hypothetical protein M3Y87_23745 [Myxococcota bacterium]|nr:hypothetical protein [Myxococcota bacterium]